MSDDTRVLTMQEKFLTWLIGKLDKRLERLGQEEWAKIDAGQKQKPYRKYW